jgi:hypothetical protein
VPAVRWGFPGVPVTRGPLWNALQNVLALSVATSRRMFPESFGLQERAESLGVGVRVGFVGAELVVVCIVCWIVEKEIVGPGGVVYGHGFVPFATEYIAA